MMGQPISSPKAMSSSAEATTRNLGHGTPTALSRWRMRALSWAWTRASGPGHTTRPASRISRNLFFSFGKMHPNSFLIYSPKRVRHLQHSFA